MMPSIAANATTDRLVMLLIALALTASVHGQSPIDPRLIVHLDAARASVTSTGTAGARSYADLVVLEVAAGRADKSRELIHLLRGMLAEADESSARFIITPLAAAQIATGDLEGAMRTMASLEPYSTQLQMLHRALLIKAVRDRGLDHARGLARQLVPDNTDRLTYYVAILIELAAMGQPQQALDFLEDQLEVAPLHMKLDGYIATAIAFDRAGKRDDAHRTVALAQRHVSGSKVPLNRINMYASVARGFAAIGDLEAAADALLLAQQTLEALSPAAHRPGRQYAAIGEAWAAMDQVDRALQYLQQIEQSEALARQPLIEAIAQAHLRAGRFDAVHQLRTTYNHPGDIAVTRGIVAAQLQQGQLDAALQTFSGLGQFDPSRTHLAQQIAHHLCKSGLYERFEAWASSINDPRLTYAIHFGAASGLIEARP